MSGAIELIKRWRPVVTSELSLEMISRVSGLQGADFLKWMASFGYRIYLLAQSFERTEVKDIDTFIADWKDVWQIEDIAFVPI